MKRIRLAVTGCCGRMGSLIVEEAFKDPACFELVAAVEREGHPKMGQPLPVEPRVRISSDLKGSLKQAALLVEFTTPESSLEHARIASEANVPMIIGTTGFSPDQFKELQALSRQIPIFWSPNMSIGVFIVRKSISSVLELLKRYGLDGTAQITISEVHHTKKKDAPSGTAKQFAADVAEIAERPLKEIPITWKREGEVVGLHTVDFGLGPERIRLEHEALDRRVFAKGALLIARHFHRIATKPGWYGMEEFYGAVAG